ncbi:hypothetical protein, partial [Streptomyces sp. NPDC048623]|uniref:hypothetical protein n=1 Tax=Streptomyces sp. NPDC048623 TaxID=3155761 RepID=UPI00343A1B4D
VGIALGSFLGWAIGEGGEVDVADGPLDGVAAFGAVRNGPLFTRSASHERPVRTDQKIML